MDVKRNPYTAGFGMIPPVLAGRDAEFADLHRYVIRTEVGRYDRPRLITGDRGYGKTVLVAEVAAQARSGEFTGKGAITIDAEVVAGTPLVEQFLISARDALRSASLDERIGDLAQRALGMLGAVSGRWGSGQFQLDVEPAVERGGDLVTDLAELLGDLDRVARADGRAVLITIDEVQRSDATTLGALATAIQRLVKRSADPRDAPRIALVLTGLPDARSHLRDVAGTYFADRVRSHELGPLADADVLEALDGPVQNEGVDWEPEALRHAIDAAEGYPYALQLIGEACWDAAQGKTIDVVAARSGVAAAQHELGAMFAARWRELPDGERRYLMAFVDVPKNDRAATEVARRMGRDVTQVATVRSRLIKERRLLREDDRGDLVLTLPGLETWIQARAHDR